MANWTLRNVAIFSSLNGDALARWEAHCQWRTVGAKERILEIDDPSRDVFFLIEGRAHVIIYSVGGQVVLFRDIEAGGMFGEFAVIDNKRRSACVEATEPCLVACITAGNFKKLLRRDNAVMQALLEHAIAQVRALTSRVFEFSTLAVKNRIHVELLRLAQEGEAKGKEVRICPFPRHLDIANRISTHREAVTRELTRLTRLEIIRREGAVIVIRDLARLTSMVRDVDGR
jgi:CRP/FNR family transcriptional regulator, cyclic AMP receptor protein